MVRTIEEVEEEEEEDDDEEEGQVQGMARV